MFTRNYRLLAYFVEVVDCGSVRAAARRLFVSAPVVSKALTDLEASLDATLLIRDRRQLRLTDAGRRVYQSAVTMTQAAVNALASVERTPAEIDGQLDINLPTELASAWLPEVLRRYRERHPGVSLEVVASDQIVPARERREQVIVRAEFVLHRSQADEAFFSLYPLCIVCAPELVGNRKAGFARQLGSIPFIGFSQTDRSNTLVAVERRSGRERLFAFDGNTYVNNAQVIKEMALRGYGAGQLTRRSVQSELAAGQLVELGTSYDFGYIGQRLIFRDPYPSAAARAFRDLVIESFGPEN